MLCHCYNFSLSSSWTHPQSRKGADLVHGQCGLLIVLARGAELQEGVMDAEEKERDGCHMGMKGGYGAPCSCAGAGRVSLREPTKDGLTWNRKHPSIFPWSMWGSRTGLGMGKVSDYITVCRVDHTPQCLSWNVRAARNCHGSFQPLGYRWRHLQILPSSAWRKEVTW